MNLCNEMQIADIFSATYKRLVVVTSSTLALCKCEDK